MREYNNNKKSAEDYAGRKGDGFYAPGDLGSLVNGAGGQKVQETWPESFDCSPRMRPGRVRWPPAAASQTWSQCHSDT